MNLVLNIHKAASWFPLSLYHAIIWIACSLVLRVLGMLPRIIVLYRLSIAIRLPQLAPNEMSMYPPATKPKIFLDLEPLRKAQRSSKIKGIRQKIRKDGIQLTHASLHQLCAVELCFVAGHLEPEASERDWDGLRGEAVVVVLEVAGTGVLPKDGADFLVRGKVL